MRLMLLVLLTLSSLTGCQFRSGRSESAVGQLPGFASVRYRPILTASSDQQSDSVPRGAGWEQVNSCPEAPDCPDHYCAAVDDRIVRHRARRLAQQNLDSMDGQGLTEDFEDGFTQAFEDVAMGQNGATPAIPPKKYWNACYRTLEGQQYAQMWFAGYEAGSASALAIRPMLFGTVAGPQHSESVAGDLVPSPLIPDPGNPRVPPEPAGRKRVVLPTEKRFLSHPTPDHTDDSSGRFRSSVESFTDGERSIELLKPTRRNDLAKPTEQTARMAGGTAVPGAGPLSSPGVQPELESRVPISGDSVRVGNPFPMPRMMVPENTSRRSMILPSADVAADRKAVSRINQSLIDSSRLNRRYSSSVDGELQTYQE